MTDETEYVATTPPKPVVGDVTTWDMNAWISAVALLLAKAGPFGVTITRGEWMSDELVKYGVGARMADDGESFTLVLSPLNTKAPEASPAE